MTVYKKVAVDFIIENNKLFILKVNEKCQQWIIIADMALCQNNNSKIK